MKIHDRISILRGDITTIAADAIVNAANSSLMGGGGVDGAIHRKGGPKILEECKEIVARQGRCKTGEAVMTTAGRLPAKYVIHTVGPVWHGGTSNEPCLLKNCYLNALKLASKYNLASISFPGISTGVYGYPKKEAAHVAFRTVAEYLGNSDDELQVLFVCYDEDSYEVYKRLFSELEKQAELK